MRAPPPVEYTSALDGAWHAASSLLVGAAVAAPLGWGLPYFAARRDDLQPSALLEALGRPFVQAALALWVAALAVAAFRLWQRASGTGGRLLRWDGQDWVLPVDARGRPEQRGDAHLMLDLGPWMLVRFLPRAGTGSATWLPLTAGAVGARWAALRGALWNWRSGAGSARP